MTSTQTMDGLVKRAGGGHHEDPTAGLENIDVQRYLGHIWWAIVLVFALYQVVLFLARYIRTVTCLGNDTQRYFATPNYYYARFKKSCLDAPLFRTRHHREFKMSSAIGVGTLPSRLQTFFLVGYLAVNIGFCVWRIDYSNFSAGASELLSRSGIMAVINMIPLFLLAGRNNPIIKLTGISFDTMNLIHRWFGRIVVLEALAHTVCWISNKVHTSKSAKASLKRHTNELAEGWAVVQKSITGSEFIMTGLIVSILKCTSTCISDDDLGNGCFRLSPFTIAITHSSLFLRSLLTRPHCRCCTSSWRSMGTSQKPPAAAYAVRRCCAVGHGTHDSPRSPHFAQRREWWYPGRCRGSPW
jgi:hypothetical protein